MIQKIKLFSLAGLFLAFCTVFIACGEPAAKEEPKQEAPVPQEPPAEITVTDTPNVTVDSTAQQRPVNRR
jgi:hypothetical protein